MLPRSCGACFAPGGACADLSALLPVSPGSRAACEHDPRRGPGACGRSRGLTARRGLWSCRKAERAARVEPTEGRPKGKPACGRSLGPGRPGEPDHKAQLVVWRAALRKPEGRAAEGVGPAPAQPGRASAYSLFQYAVRDRTPALRGAFCLSLAPVRWGQLQARRARSLRRSLCRSVQGAASLRVKP